MAWWNTFFIFQNDALIAEGFEPPFLHNLKWIEQEAGTMPPERDKRFTKVIVSGYALYGKLRGYYALGIAHWQLDRATGSAYLSEISQRHCEPVSSLTPAQRAIVRECLIRLDPEAWETSNFSFRQQLEV